MRKAWTLTCRSSSRRRSPSVKTPRTASAASTTTVIPRPLRDISRSPCARVAPGAIRGRSAPVRMMSSTRRNSRRPNVPPGCERAKSVAVKPRASSSVTASASPMASIAVVLAVGARLSGQASSGTVTSKATVALRASVEARLPVRVMSGVARRFRCGSRNTSSGLSPELDKASTTSLAVIMPRSPWLASAACRKNPGVPVLANVAAILRPTCPDLPMPVTITRPVHARHRRQAATNSGPSRPPSASTARASMASARRAALSSVASSTNLAAVAAVMQGSPRQEYPDKGAGAARLEASGRAFATMGVHEPR